MSGRFTVRNPHGLHARPAARLVQEVRRLAADVELVNLTTGAGPEPGSSMIRVAVLGAAQGHEVEVRARTQEAVDAVVALAERGFDESFETPHEPAADQEPATSAGGPRGASPGVVLGPARRLVSAPLEVSEAGGTPEEESGRLDVALAAARGEVEATHRALRQTPEAEIFEAHLALLDDDSLLGRARALVAEGRSAAAAWTDAVAEVHDEWAALDDPYLRERAADVDAVGEQVLRSITGVAPAAMPAAGVLLADDLTPAEAAALDLDLVQGVVLAAGSPTSHAAILARARDVPLVVGAGDLARTAPDGATVALDGSTGEVHVDPSDEVRRDFERRAEAEREQRRTALDAAQRPAATTDGVTVVVGANLGSVADAELARASGADKAGLVRTELLFLGRDDAPGEDEQATTYAAVAAALDRRVTLRTLDVGGDKPLPYVAAPAEDNPFLGVRGVRLSLRHPDLLRTQLAAMARVADDADVEVMVPMVAVPAEMDAVRALLPEGSSLRLGMMVEVPSAALKLPALAAHVDFVSIGTNDLTQYAVAAERGNPGVAELGDPLDPGVLQLVERVVAAGLPTGVCGEAAADPAGVPLLLGLGVRELSVAPPAVPRVKALVRTLDTASCAALAREALTLPDAAAVRRLVAGS
nr:phosphoenolpyruvate--protein phosphotransferase [Nocardioides aequoreus]